MGPDPGTKLTLSIWRDFVPARPLTLPGEEGSQLLDSESGLQEEVYHWRLREDVFAGITDDRVRSDLHEGFVGKLGDSKRPAERRLPVLASFVAAAETAIESGVVVAVPAESGSTSSSDAEDPNPAGIRSLLALIIHLKWILACFRNRPGISVSVR